MSKTQDRPVLLPSSRVRSRYDNISDMTLRRWMQKGFPAPIHINGRRYWREADLAAWEQAQGNKGEAA